MSEIEDAEDFVKSLMHHVNHAKKPIPKEEPKKGGQLMDELSGLIRKVGQYYGTDPIIVSKFRKNLIDNDDKTVIAVKRLKDIVQDLDSKKNPDDKRVFCKDCVNFGNDQACTCAKAGNFGAHLTRLRPAPYVPRTCNDYFPSPDPLDFPPPPGKIRVVEKDPQKTQEYGYHPHDERWIRESISAKFQMEEDANKMMENYKEKFRTFYTDPQCPKNGKDGFARRMTNIWLREELEKQELKLVQGPTFESSGP
ncbi:MAG TPA: hypothetical protein VIY47_10870 [Ignavibacteriaceae bacterium]